MLGETFQTTFPNIPLPVFYKLHLDANVGSAAGLLSGTMAPVQSNNGGDMILGKFSMAYGGTGTVFSYYGGNGTDIANSIDFYTAGAQRHYLFLLYRFQFREWTVNNLTETVFIKALSRGAWDMFYWILQIWKQKAGHWLRRLRFTWVIPATRLPEKMRILSDSSVGILPSHFRRLLPT